MVEEGKREKTQNKKSREEKNKSYPGLNTLNQSHKTMCCNNTMKKSVNFNGKYFNNKI